jgi:hypothetical protein
MPVRGKHGKPNPGFPPFPPPLEIPQTQRDSHIPTALVIDPDSQEVEVIVVDTEK